MRVCIRQMVFFRFSIPLTHVRLERVGRPGRRPPPRGPLAAAAAPALLVRASSLAVVRRPVAAAIGADAAAVVVLGDVRPVQVGQHPEGRQVDVVDPVRVYLDGRVDGAARLREVHPTPVVLGLHLPGRRAQLLVSRSSDPHRTDPAGVVIVVAAAASGAPVVVYELVHVLYEAEPPAVVRVDLVLGVHLYRAAVDLAEVLRRGGGVAAAGATSAVAVRPASGGGVVVVALEAAARGQAQESGRGPTTATLLLLLLPGGGAAVAAAAPLPGRGRCGDLLVPVVAAADGRGAVERELDVAIVVIVVAEGRCHVPEVGAAATTTGHDLRPLGRDGYAKIHLFLLPRLRSSARGRPSSGRFPPPRSDANLVDVVVGDVRLVGMCVLFGHRRHDCPPG